MTPIARADWPRLLDLVEQALDLAEPEREAWLQAQDLPTGLQAALRGLLAERREIEGAGFLGAPPAWEAAVAAQPAGPVAGDRIGPWRLVREIGQGGMSTVWLAERADGQVQREVALKLPHAGPGQRLLAERLLRERNILAALAHRHIARLYDVGVTDAGTPYLVMEHVAGTTLSAWADAQRLTPTRRVQLFRQVLSAVQYAHARLVLHRDLKPGNILVDASGDAKLLDFGIAKLLTAGAPLAETELTRAHGRQLTPRYASPEQLRGLPLGTGSDVYSLGVVLYELLCGHAPHALPGMSAARLEEAVLHQDPRPPSRQKPEAAALQARSTTAPALRKVLAGDLDAIVLKALGRTPEQRYASVDAFDADLARWLAGVPVTARPPSTWGHLSKFVRRHRLGVAVGTTVAALLIAAVGVALVQARIATQEASRAKLVRDFLVGMFNETDPDRPTHRTLTAKTLLDNGSRRASHELAGTPDLQAELLQSIGKAQAGLADRRQADATLAQAVDAFRSAGNRRGEQLALLDRADNALSLGRHQDALEMVQQAAKLDPEAARRDVTLRRALSKTEGYVAQFNGALVLAKESFGRYLALSGPDSDAPPLEQVQVLQSLAWTISQLSESLPDALALIDRALQILRDHPELPVAANLDVRQYRQDIEFRWGSYARIAEESPEDIRRCDAAVGPSHVTCLKLRGRLQAAQLRLGYFVRALELEPALAAQLDPDSPRDRARALGASARTRAFNGDTGELGEPLAELRRIAEGRMPPSLDPPYRLRAFNTVAEVELLAGRPGEALVTLIQAGELAVANGMTSSGERRRTLLLKGVALHRRGQVAEALDVLRPLCTSVDRSDGAARVESHFYALNCVLPLVAHGERQAALTLLDQVLPVLRENLGAQAPTVLRAERWQQSLRAGRETLSPHPIAESLFS